MIIFLFFFFNFLVVSSNFIAATPNESFESHLKTYIIHLEPPENMIFTSYMNREEWYRSFIAHSTSTSSNGIGRLLYSYHVVICGFAARLTEEEVKILASMEGFLSAQLDRIYHLSTTHSPQFLGLHKRRGVWKHSNFGRGVIIGVLDTGISPSHPSFNDDGVSPPPSTWKGKCEFLNRTMCNNKIIGARKFLHGLATMKSIASATIVEPFDDVGHGTHTASIAAGNFAQKANLFGQANGTAVGMAPLAHLAIYKVCDTVSCSISDVLAGVEAAVSDGVDIISFSLAMKEVPFNEDPFLHVFFRAMEKGILVSCSAGNDGPRYRSLSNVAPWVLTVGASGMDRSIVAVVKLGNGKEFQGEAIFQPNHFTSTPLPLAYPGINGPDSVRQCQYGSLDDIDVKGRIVMCDSTGEEDIVKGTIIKEAGGVAMLLMNDKFAGFTIVVGAHVIPVSHVSFRDGLKIKEYFNASSAPTARIVLKGTVIGTSPAVVVASFSSRGPSM